MDHRDCLESLEVWRFVTRSYLIASMEGGKPALDEAQGLAVASVQDALPYQLSFALVLWTKGRKSSRLELVCIARPFQISKMQCRGDFKNAVSWLAVSSLPMCSLQSLVMVDCGVQSGTQPVPSAQRRGIGYIMKHVYHSLLWIQQKVRDIEVKNNLIDTQLNVADIGTKYRGG
eukprot:4112226-Amphidinium_carterae.2